MADKTFEDVYAGYVIKNVGVHSNAYGYYVSNYVTCGGDWSALKSYAAKFTKAKALDYINSVAGEWVIEDCT